MDKALAAARLHRCPIIVAKVDRLTRSVAFLSRLLEANVDVRWIGGGHGGDRRLPGLASASAKLLRAYCLQVETYRRQRNAGDQNIRVEHVHVYEGGQAIVGAVGSRTREVER